MAKNKAKAPMKKGDKRCYKSEAIAIRVAGGLKKRGKRATVTGKCVTVN